MDSGLATTDWEHTSSNNVAMFAVEANVGKADMNTFGTYLATKGQWQKYADRMRHMS